MMRRIALGLLLLAAACSGAHANQPVQQSGTVTSGHLPSWVTSNVVQDAGTSTAPKINSLGLYGAGGTPLCISASATPGPYSSAPYRLCAGVSSSTGGYLALTTGASPATALPFSITIDGATVFSSASGVAPTFPLAAGQFIVGTVSGTSSAASMTGDCTLVSGSPGSISCPNVLNNNYASSRGSVLYYGASGWTTLAPGTAGQVLATGGAGANPSWANASSAPIVNSTINNTPIGNVTPASGSFTTLAAASGSFTTLAAAAGGSNNALYVTSNSNPPLKNNAGVRFDFNPSGTITPLSGQYSYASFTVDSDTVNASTYGTTALYLGHSISTGAVGGRTGIGVALNQTGATTANPGSDTSGGTYYVGAAFKAVASNSAGGTAGVLAGNLFATNDIVNLNAGAGLYWNSLIGYELDVSVAQGNAVGYKHGVQIVEGRFDATQGTFEDTAFVLGVGAVSTGATVTGKIDNGSGGAGTVFTVTGVTSGAIVGTQTLVGPNIASGTRITSFETGTGGIGTYTVNISQNVPITTVYVSDRAVGWQTGIAFGSTLGWWGMAANSTLIGVNNELSGAYAPPDRVAKIGIDFSTMTFSMAAFKSLGFMVDGSGNTTAAALTTNLLTSTAAGSTLTVKAGPSGTALMQIGTSSSYPVLKTLVPLELPGLAWGGTSSDEAPVYQNGTFSGTTTSGKAGLGAFLKATDNSVCTNEDSDGGCFGLRVHTLVGAGAAGARSAASGILDITAATLNNCTFSATGSSISGTTYSVGTVTSGTVQVGCLIAGSGVANGTVITANISGSGTGSTWTVSPSQTTGTIATAGTNNSMQYVGVFGKCNLLATDGSSGSYATCFGMNAVGHVKAGVSASQVVGAEVDTWTETTSVVQDRIGVQIVDVTGTTYGSQATRDDVAFSINSQYATDSGLGYKIGIEFGRNGSNGIGVATNGTLMYAQGNGGATATVANGLDWSKLTFTGNAINVSGLIVTGAGDAQLNSASALARNAAVGFMHFPHITGASGVPNGTPTNTNGPACVWNDATLNLNCYSGGAWYHAVFSAGAG
jgi:hypothetical protein